jgi:hypothetical protein
VETAGAWRNHPDMDEYVEDLRADREQVEELQPGA